MHSPSLTGAWMDGQISLGVADGGMWVSALFSSLCFLKGGNGETEAQTQASLSALKGVRGLVEKGHVNRQRAQGAGWPLRSRASHVMPQSHTEHSDPPLWNLSRRGRQRTLHFHIHLRRKDTPVADDVASKLFGSH